MTEYLQARHSEPCCRGALKNTVAVEERLTQRALHGTVYKELPATATPGREPRHAPRIPVAILEGLESTVMDETCVFFLRTYAWWVLLQCWATLRFSDHKRPEPRPRLCSCGKHPDGQTYALENHRRGQETEVPNGFSHGVWFRLTAELVFSGLEPAQGKGKLLREKASFRRDYLLPSPTSNCREGTTIRDRLRDADKALHYFASLSRSLALSLSRSLALSPLFRKQSGARSPGGDRNPGRSHLVPVDARSVSGSDKQVLEALESQTRCGDPTHGRRTD